MEVFLSFTTRVIPSLEVAKAPSPKETDFTFLGTVAVVNDVPSNALRFIFFIDAGKVIDLSDN